MGEGTTTSDALPRELPAEQPRAPRRRLPVATYRLQLHAGFGFAAAAAVVPYLDGLGITDCYTSPHLKARPGSTHGYDIVDHTALNPELDGASDYDAFAAALAARGMGNLVDFVPNHMGVDAAANPWWRDVLENGRGSTYAPFFDIDWHPVKAELKDKVLLPILGDQYGAVLERGELQLHFGDGAFTLRYGTHDLPIAPGQIPQILSHQLDQLRARLGDEHPELNEYLSIITELRNLPPPTEIDPVQVAERQREKDVARERLRRLVERAPRVREHIDACVAAFNAPTGHAVLHGLLEAQAYRLANWRTASHEINYRRFFDINELAGLRVEDPRVFTATHALLLQLVAAGHISGIRLDHIDGLFDPAGYLAALQDAIAAARQDDAAPEGNSAAYVVVEKILAADEHLPAEWPVAGTTGYDFLNLLNGLFVDRRNQRALLRLHARFTGEQRSFADILYESKTLIMRAPMASELHVLAVALNRLSEHDWHTRDFTLTSLRGALREVVACFPVYRTYVSAAGYRDSDRQAVDTAIARARRRNPTMEPSIFGFLRSVLLPDPNARPAGAYAQRLEFAMKFQQYTGPVEAKGREDTSFYRYAPLASLNEVGGGPERFGRTPQEFHAANQERLAAWGTGLLATATHDTKRGEDARARLNVLSECPAEWGRQVSTSARINATNRSRVDGEAAPDRRDEYLFYQTLLGAWPARATAVDATLVERLTAFMLKAAREAKVHTSWLTQNAPYEEALTRFVERVLTGRTAARFLELFLPFQARIAELGMVNSLAQLVLKLVAPGVPDFFQGTELWDLSLVDPDNRRPVDYARRQQLLAELDAARVDTPAERRAWLGALLDHWDDARIKLLITAELLRLRRRNAALFLTGTYEPLEVRGAHADHVVALTRRHGEQVVLAVVPRLVAGLTTRERRLPLGADCWQDTAVMLPPDLAALPLRDLFTHEPLVNTDGSLPLSAALSTLPVAVLGGEVGNTQH
jgi:(1->4)-alpha-D-glucan 1-alpha-D-glucosylmutase